MASTYVNDLRLNEMATGDESGNWGVVTNLNLELIGEALGYGTEGITTNADTHTTTVADGATDPGRAMYIEYTGTLDSACTITIAPNTLNRMHFIENGTSGSQNIIISQGSGANITIPPGDTKAVYLDGAGSGAAVVDAFASLSVVDLKVQDDLTVTDDVSIGGALTLTGNGDFNGDLDVDGTTNLDVVDIDGAVDMASTLQVDGAITSSAGATITVADNSDNLTLTSTDADANAGPNLRMYRNSGSPADSDAIGLIDFEGRNDNSQDVVYAAIDTRIVDASDGTEDGRLEVATILGGTAGVSRVLMDSTETVFNDNSKDLDFRVESNGNANMLFVDGGNDVVTIGGATGETGDTFSVTSSGANDVNTRLVNTNADANGVKLVFEKNSASPADNDELGELAFLGNDSAGNSTTYASIRTFSTDVTNGTEDGTITLNVRFNDSLQERIRLQGDSNHITITGKDNDSNQIKFIDNGGTIDGYIYTENTEIGFLDADGNWTIQAKNDTSIFFAINGSEAGRFISTGCLSLGDSTPESGDADAPKNLYLQGADSNMVIKNTAANSSSQRQGICFLNSSGTRVGTIAIRNTGTDYITSSDYRLKENIVELPNGLNRLMSLNPVQFDWKLDGATSEGFIAHELHEQFAYAVMGEKDGKEMQSLDYGRITPLLVKAIQEQQEQIEQLKTEISKLH